MTGTSAAAKILEIEQETEMRKLESYSRSGTAAEILRRSNYLKQLAQLSISDFPWHIHHHTLLVEIIPKIQQHFLYSEQGKEGTVYCRNHGS